MVKPRDSSSEPARVLRSLNDFVVSTMTLARLLLASAIASVAFLLQGCSSIESKAKEIWQETTQTLKGDQAAIKALPTAFAVLRQHLTDANRAILQHKPTRSVIDGEWCGLDFPPQTGSDEDMFVDCSCCASHLMTSPKDYGALLFGSGPTQLDTWNTDGRRETLPHVEVDDNGRIKTWYQAPAWSVGGRNPTLFCDEDHRQLLCRCEDVEKGWQETQLVCSDGGKCQPPREYVELVSAPKDFVDKAPQSQAGPDVSDCSNKTQPRASIGKSLCEDAKVETCSMLYAKYSEGDPAVSNGWHHCEVKPNAKVCHATQTTRAKAVLQENEARSAALKQWYRPDLGWKATVDSSAHVLKIDQQKSVSALAGFFDDQVSARKDRKELNIEELLPCSLEDDSSETTDDVAAQKKQPQCINDGRACKPDHHCEQCACVADVFVPNSK